MWLADTILLHYPSLFHPIQRQLDHLHTHIIQYLCSPNLYFAKLCFLHIKIRKNLKKTNYLVWNAIYILMASFRLCISFSPPLLLDIFLQSFNHITFSPLSSALFSFYFFFFYYVSFCSLVGWFWIQFPQATAFTFLSCFCLWVLPLPFLLWFPSTLPSTSENIFPLLSSNLISAFRCYIGK